MFDILVFCRKYTKKNTVFGRFKVILPCSRFPHLICYEQLLLYQLYIPYVIVKFNRVPRKKNQVKIFHECVEELSTKGHGNKV